MKKLFKSVAVAAILFAGSCQKYDDSTLWGRVDDLENRVARLEELCRQMNTNIASLQTIVSALQNNDYVTGVVPVVYNGEAIGYTITFAKSTPITIYHGQNGKDGVNGNGPAPVIGVRQDTDGIYYWTLGGEWLLDENGNKIKAKGRDGANGQDGKPGTDGKDGITPQLKIENDYWYVSTDNGATWTQLGKATGENGKDGADSSDSIFKSITQDDDYIYFALKNGENIVIPKKQQLAITFSGGTSLLFDIDETKTVSYTITGGGTNNVVKAEMQNRDGVYILKTTPASATNGTITITTAIIPITSKIPTTNNVIVSVSDGTQTIMTAIAVSIKPSFEENVITVETPGTLWQLLADYNKSSITELTVIGNLDNGDIATLKNLPNLFILDMENANLEELPAGAFKNNKSLTFVKLPKTLKTIGGSAFAYCSSLASVTIPDSVTSIGDTPFICCSGLTSITIPDSITSIGYCAFYDCSSLTSVTIPNSVTEIGRGAFAYCSSLTSITIPDSVTSIGHEAFSDCSGLTSVIIPDGVTSIGIQAFGGCSSLTSITIPNSVTSIGIQAFGGCSSLTSITIPNSVTSIGKNAFSTCSGLTAFYGKFASSDNRCLIVDGYLNSFAPAGLTSYTIPNSVTEIGDYAFSGCSNLTSITIPDSVTSIGRERAFWGCSSLSAFYGKFASSDNRCLIVDGYLNSFAPAGLTSYTIPDSVTSIGETPFFCCSGLTSITIPNSVTEIGDYAFYNCNSLTSIYCKAQTPPSVGTSAFSGINTSLISLYVPTGSKAAYATANGWKYFRIIETQF